MEVGKEREREKAANRKRGEGEGMGPQQVFRTFFLKFKTSFRCVFS